MSQTKSGIRLPTVLAIGFRGDTILRDTTAARAGIHAFLAARVLDPNRVLCGLTGLDTPADLLFAESCFALNIPVRVLLPTRPDNYDPTLIARAISVETLSNSGSPVELSYECGVEIAERSQLLLALTDEPSSNASAIDSTASIIHFARELGRPVFLINTIGDPPSESAEQAFQHIGHDPELYFLATLPDEGVTLADDSPLTLANAWFDKIDRNANRLAPQVLRLAWLPILCTAAAAFASGAASHGATGTLWLTVGAVLGILAAVLPMLLRLGPRQALWARSRFAAEVCRSVLTLWDTPAGFHVFTPEMIPELAGMLRSLDLLKALGGSPNGAPIQQFKTSYLTDRVNGQIRYFAKTTLRAAKEAQRFHTVGLAAVATAIAFSIYSFASHILFHANAHAWIALAASALFQISAVAGALRIVNDCDRRQRRYREIGDLLKRRERELSVLETWPPVLKAVTRIEHALLVELIEWRSLIQNIKMPRN